MRKVFNDRSTFRDMLDPAASRVRQQRLLPAMKESKVDAIVVGLPVHVYYLSAHDNFWQHQSSLALFRDGQTLLIRADKAEGNVAAERVETYEATWMGTQRMDQPAIVGNQMARAVKARGARTVGVDTSAVSQTFARAFEGEAEMIAPMLWQSRRQKDPDELALMRRAIECTRKMHERARKIVEVGVGETRVFAELYATAVLTAGVPLSPAYLGNDFRCGSPGGLPRNGRTAQAGELYILDLGPAVGGYFSDNSRAYSVDRKPTDAQLKAWEIVTAVFPIIERMAKPGVSCRELFSAIDEHYHAATGEGFPHHLGHGVGLQPHEFPHLNPKWDDKLMEGEVFTVEPGLYGEHLGGGMRIENQYLVTKDGVENLTPFPMKLA
jgi:Xaa-Pro dipeptidase